MVAIYNILEELRANNSSNYKLEVLEKYKDNETFKKFLFYVYNPRYNYWIKQIPEDNLLLTKYSDIFEDEQFFKVFDKLRNREKTGNEAIEYLANNMNIYFAKVRELFELVIGRDIKCNVSVKSINKVFPNLLKEIPYCRCSKESDIDLNKLYDKHKFLYIQKKSDGVFSYIIKQEDKVKLLTRAGTEWECESLSEDLQHLPNDTVLVGEALIKHNGKELSRKEGNGLINSFVKRFDTADSLREKIDKASDKARPKLLDKLAENIGEWTFIGQDLHFEVWDILTVEEFEQGLSIRPYSRRLTELEVLIPKINSQKVSIIETEICYFSDEINPFVTKMYEQGYEGAVIKTPTLTFQNKTSKEQIKVKAEKDCDLLCTGIEEGTGKYIGKIGSLICQSSDGKLVVNVGTKLTDKDREKDPSEYIGKVVAVGYNEKIKSKTSDTWALFLPKYLETRLDKTVADSFEEIE